MHRQQDRVARRRLIPSPGVALLAAMLCAAPAAAQCNFTNPNCLDTHAPQATISPGTGSFSTQSVSVTISYAELADMDVGLDPTTLIITLRGTDATPAFTYGGTIYQAQSAGTITLNAGTNVLYAYICDKAGHCSSSSATYTYNPPPPPPGTYGVAVTPDAAPLAVPAASKRVQAFVLRNTGTVAASYQLTATCSGTGASGCSVGSSSATLAAGASASVAATFTSGAAGSSGRVTLTATQTSPQPATAVSDSGWANVTAAAVAAQSNAGDADTRAWWSGASASPSAPGRTPRTSAPTRVWYTRFPRPLR